MSHQEQYQQKIQAQLHVWKTDIELLKAKAVNASTDAKLELHQQADLLEIKLEEGKAKLAQFAEASHDTWESVKDNAEAVWNSVKTSFHDAKDKFKG